MNNLVEQFKKINELQDQLILLCDEKIACISHKKMNEANAVIKKEMLVLYDVEQALMGLKTTISQVCHQYGLPVGKLDILFPYVTTEEKEQLMACQRYAFSCEKIIKNKLKNSERQVQMEMALPEILHRTRMQHLQENGGQSTIYNQKF